MSKVKFWALINDEIQRVSAVPDQFIVDFFQDLKDNRHTSKYVPAKLAFEDCMFYQLTSPVSMVDKDDSEQRESGSFEKKARELCLEEGNKVRVNPKTKMISRLAEVLSSHCIHLVIEFSDPLEESKKAIDSILKHYRVLFECLRVTVGQLTEWTVNDVIKNLRRGELSDDINELPHEFKEIQDVLERKRLYKTQNPQTRDLQNALAYRIEFNRVFQPIIALTPSTGRNNAATENDGTVNNREFAAFYNVLRCFGRDVTDIQNDTSSYLKASNFTVHFIQPPFFCEQGSSTPFEYQAEKQWSFPFFVGTERAPNVCRKFTPKSDWMVISSRDRVPFIISVVISQKQEEDRNRMLLQAIVLARTGQYLMKSTSKRKFFIVAIYINASMIASRYIVMRTGSGSDVSIYRKDFQLTDTNRQVDFLREMYNLATLVATFAGDLDENKLKDLANIKVAAGKLLSLNSTKNPPTRTSKSATMHSIPEGEERNSGLQDEDDLGVFEAEDIQNILRQMNYKIEFIPWGHPQLAVVVNVAEDKHGYLKFVEHEREVEILRYLTQIESPFNHTISGVRFWPVQSGTVISMPVAGGWLTSLEEPDKQLWSVAQQLFEAVAFMHEHNVAHMDIKPQNVIIPPEGGRLSIIDFSASIRVRGLHVTYNGVVGTEDYMAPEIRRGDYKPMLTDLWSCGRTVEELCSCCTPSAEWSNLLDIAGRLMNRDPEARPRMTTVLEWMAAARRGEDEAISPPFRLVPPITPLCA